MSADKLRDAPSCARNREPILAQLCHLLAGSGQVLEIGSGTGQHAVYFAPRLPHVTWQVSDRRENLADIRAWLAAEPAANLPPPLELDVCGDWPPLAVDAIFTANTLHIMSPVAVEAFFANVPQVLRPGGRLIVYGPMKIRGEFVGASNAQFDQNLRERDSARGIRDLEWLDQLAGAAGLQREALKFLPANNQLVVWRRTAMEGS